MKLPKYLTIILILLFIFLNLRGEPATATIEYAQRTGKGCSFCHRDNNGGPLNAVGIAYVRNNYDYPIPERILDKSRQLSTPVHQTARLICGYIHLVAVCVLVGTIFYIHLFVKPANITGGIPRGERILGLICLAVLLVTGAYLTWYRLDSFAGFFASHFGILLFIKLLLFALMVILALLAVTVIHRRMRAEARAQAAAVDKREVTSDTLAQYDGTNGKPAYILYQDTVYDVTDSPKWKEGKHFRKHAAGRDLTTDLAGAPHADEVFADLPVITTIAEPGEAKKSLSLTRKIYIGFAYANSIITFLILLCVSGWLWGFPFEVAKTDTSYHRAVSVADECADCHARDHENVLPGIYHDWERSIHAKVGVSCADCHRVNDDADVTISERHLANSPIPISALVTPKRCRGCHPDSAAEYARSKHAHTLEIINQIDKWLIYGMNNATERSTGCYACHGSVVEFARGQPVAGTWPNVGVGRVNPDGSKGSCTSCHTRHRFSIEEARKPEACDQCHLGPDHPQIEIYNESKHGTIYHAEGAEWQWRPNDGQWRAGRDYRAPTCASCHMSAAPGVARSHDVTERLSWELQAPLTIRPADFAPFPAKTSWAEERRKMQQVCLQCHSVAWTSGHFDNLDAVIHNYNEIYYEPVHQVLTDLYAAGLLAEDSYFDEPLEWEFYEFWHHEGRRARMGAAMMAPDYAWWHGFYEVKHRYVTFMAEAEELRELGQPREYEHFPGEYGDSLSSGN